MTKDPLSSYLLKLTHYFQQEFSEQAMKKYLADIGHLALKCGKKLCALFPGLSYKYSSIF